MKISQIKASIIQSFINGMRENGYNYGENRKGSYSDESIRTTKTILSSLLSAAVEDGLIQTNPCSVRTRKNKKVSKRKVEKRSFSVDETVKFLEVIEHPIPIVVEPRRAKRHGVETDISGYVLKEMIVDIKFQALFIVTVFSGVRREEILGL